MPCDQLDHYTLQYLFDAFGMFRRAPRPLAVACGFALYALYDEDTTTHARAHTDTHAHTMRCELKSVVLAGRPQGRCCMRHRVSVSAAAGTGSQAQHKEANAACTCHVSVVWP